MFLVYRSTSAFLLCVFDQASEAMILAAEAPLPGATGGVLVRTLLPPGRLRQVSIVVQLVLASNSDCIKKLTHFKLPMDVMI